MDSQHERQQSRLEARSEAYSRQGRPAKGLSASRDRSQHLHPGGLGKDPQVQHPIEPRTRTGQGRQGHQFFRTVRKILPAKRWRKWKKDKEAINLSVKLAEKPEVKRRGYIWPYGADKAEPVTGYPVGYPPRPPYSEICNRPPNQGYRPYPPPRSEIYNGPPHQGYQPYPPPRSEIYNGPPHQGYQPYPPPHPSYHPYPPNPAYPPNPPPCPSYHSYPPNPTYPPNPPPCPSHHPYPPNLYSQVYSPHPYQPYQSLYPPNPTYPPNPPPCPSHHPYPPNPGYPPNPPPCPSHHPYPPNPGYPPNLYSQVYSPHPYQSLQDIASSVAVNVSEDLIKYSIGTFFSDGNNDGNYVGGSSF